MYLSIKEVAVKWNISERRIRVLCTEDKIKGAYKEGGSWRIPEGVPKPKDSRYKSKISLFDMITYKKFELNKKRPLTQGELERLNEQFMIEYTYNSNAIEGNTLTLRETDLVLKGLTIDKKPLKDHIEALSHKEAFEYIVELVQNKTEITESIIKQIHFLVLSDKKEDRGVYRKIPVMIMGAKHVPVQPFMIVPMMDKFLRQYKDSNEHIVTKMARFHINFEAIHPFIDGNGRCGRLLINLELMKEGYPPIDIKYSDRINYYNAFDEYHINGSLKAMEKLISKYLNNRLDTYLALIQ